MRYSRLSLAFVILSCLLIYAQGQGGNYVEVDPAISQMEAYLNQAGNSPVGPIAPAPSVSPPSASQPPTSQPSATPSMVSPQINIVAATNISALNAVGKWQLNLTGGTSMDLALNQSGNIVFGHGNVTSVNNNQWATASGFIQGSSLRLDVVPSDGTKLYALGIDVSKSPPTGTYNIYESGKAPQFGTVRANRS